MEWRFCFEVLYKKFSNTLCKTIWPLKINLISSRKLNGVSPVQMQVFKDSCHWVGRASIKKASLKASNGDRCKTLKALLIISSFLFEIKSPTWRIPFSARFRKYTDLSPIQINLLFHKITFVKSFHLNHVYLNYLPQSTLQKILSILHKRLVIW